MIDDKQLKKFSNKKLKDIKEKLSKTDVIDMDIQWEEKDKIINCRMIVSWNPVANYFQYLTTNLPRDTFSPEHIIEAYRLRWQIELMFKEWKSFANLRTFVTEKSHC
ncbi:transposase [sulfur-oxidizing endosymbiont of Gigantopelta aegis]|uniref:transposase n=1 Tax=sulfur-oxidizing endosymbiont of Gigantopelta aegis TaxID=2794934 RepID=UPI0031B5CFCA